MRSDWPTTELPAMSGSEKAVSSAEEQGLGTRIYLADGSGKRSRLTAADIRERVRQERNEATRAKRTCRVEAIERRAASMADRMAYLQVWRELERSVDEDWLRLRVPVRKARKRPTVEGRTYVPESRRSRPRLLPSYSKPVIDPAGRQGIYYRARYVSGKAGASHVGCAKAVWRYFIRAGAYEISAVGVPSVVSNMGMDALEIGACCDLLESVQRSARANGKLFTTIEVNLPHDISPEARLVILHEFCENAFGAYDLPYCAAVHHPSPEGDQRNTHAHIMVWWRPTVRTAPYEWSVAKHLATEHDSQEMTTGHRELFAATMTRVSTLQGHNRTYTGLSHAARGLAIKPTKKIGKERAQMYRRGEAIPMVARNAETIRSNEKILATEAARATIAHTQDLADKLSRTRRLRAVSARCESIRDSHRRADLIQGAGWMEVGMDGQAVINGSAFASTGRG